MESVQERMQRLGTKNKIAYFIAKEKEPYEFKRRYARIRAEEFARECDGRGLNYHVSVGGLDSMELLEDDGQMAMFLKIQFLEGAKRKELFDKYPPKYIYVFRNRMATWNSGLEKDPKTGKRWATTMCHAWFVWEKGSTSEPVVRWL